MNPPRPPNTTGLIRRTERYSAGEDAQGWTPQPPAAAPFDPATGFPWNQPQGEEFFQPQDVPEPDSAVALTFASYDVSTGFPWNGDSEVGQFVPAIDDTIQSWAIQPPAVATTPEGFWNADDSERFVASTITDDTPGAFGQPPLNAVALTEFAVDGGDSIQAVPTEDPTLPAWSVTPPQNAVAALVFNQPDEAPYQTVEDPTVPALTVQPPSYIPVFQLSAWSVEGGEVLDVPTIDDSIQAWAVGTPLNAVGLTTFAVDDAPVAQVASLDETAQAGTLGQPAEFTPHNADDIVQPVWWTPDDSAQAWPIQPPVPFVGTRVEDQPFPWWVDQPTDQGWSAWAATSVVTVIYPAVVGPVAVSTSPAPNGLAAALGPNANVVGLAPSSEVVSPGPNGAASAPHPGD